VVEAISQAQQLHPVYFQALAAASVTATDVALKAQVRGFLLSSATHQYFFARERATLCLLFCYAKSVAWTTMTHVCNPC
jgi:hypothetical protein